MQRVFAPAKNFRAPAERCTNPMTFPTNPHKEHYHPYVKYPALRNPPTITHRVNSDRQLFEKVFVRFKITSLYSHAVTVHLSRY